jgi:hypothetical protein
MKKILPLNNPVIDVFGGYACTNSIYMDQPKGISWFVQNYINYVVLYDNEYRFVCSDYMNIDSLYFNSVTCFQLEGIVNVPIKTYSIPKDQIEEGDIIRYVKKQIDLGYYVCLFVNLQEIKKYNYEYPGNHDIFIYGYDDEEQVVYATGYVGNSPYQTLKHSYDEVMKAFHSLDDTINYNHEVICNYDTEKVTIMRYNENFVFKFSKEQLIKDLEYYINLKEYSMSFTPKINRYSLNYNTSTVYGNKHYDILEKHLECIANYHQYIDFRQFYFVLQHKQIMLYRLHYLSENSYLTEHKFIEGFEEIVHLCKRLLNMVMKYNAIMDVAMGNNKTLLQKMVEMLKEIKTKEENLLLEVIKELKK